MDIVRRCESVMDEEEVGSEATTSFSFNCTVGRNRPTLDGVFQRCQIYLFYFWTQMTDYQMGKT